MCVKPGKVGRLSYSLLHSARACAITDRVNNGEGLGIGKRNVAKKKTKTCVGLYMECTFTNGLPYG